MTSETFNTKQVLAKQPASRINWLWIIGTGLGALMGAVVAVAVFPSAAFGQNPTGQFGWHLVGFALAVGIPFGLAQWWILRYIPRYRETANLPFLLWWIPVTSIGIACMILPLWGVDATVLFFSPPSAVVLMLPGMLVLGLFQWLVLYRVIHARFVWVPLTIVGAAIGAVVGLIAAFMIARAPLALEATWAFVQGVNIAALQRIALVRDLDADLGRGEGTQRRRLVALSSVNWQRWKWPLVGGGVAILLGGLWWYQAAQVPVFRDTLKSGPQGPEMVMIPAGSFMMGSPDSEWGRSDREGPQHHVTVGTFSMGRYEVTFEEYDAFAQATGRKRPDDRGWGRSDRPVINVSWDDAVAYADWLAEQTGKRYRLPTEAEWEYAARAGTETAHWWEDRFFRRTRANCNDCNDKWKDRTAPVGSFSANAFGLHDVSGNVSEWVQDCWHADYWGAPEDGSPWEVEPGVDCGRRVLRGGSWSNNPSSLRSAHRFGARPDSAFYSLGFRLARDS